VTGFSAGMRNRLAGDLRTKSCSAASSRMERRNVRQCFVTELDFFFDSSLSHCCISTTSISSSAVSPNLSLMNVRTQTLVPLVDSRHVDSRSGCHRWSMNRANVALLSARIPSSRWTRSRSWFIACERVRSETLPMTKAGCRRIILPVAASVNLRLKCPSHEPDFLVSQPCWNRATSLSYSSPTFPVKL
jgi:hypothetical protein